MADRVYHVGVSVRRDNLVAAATSVEHIAKRSKFPGFFLEVEGYDLSVVATDGHRLAIYRIQLATQSTACRKLFPPTALPQWRAATEEVLDLVLDDSYTDEFPPSWRAVLQSAKERAVRSVGLDPRYLADAAMAIRKLRGKSPGPTQVKFGDPRDPVVLQYHSEFTEVIMSVRL
jgi:hypothetical protein